MRRTTSPLARYLAVAYALLVAYGSLHPFVGWREPSAPLLAFLDAAWPRYYTGVDLAANLLAYVPLGFLLVPALHPRMRLGSAALLAGVAAAALSFSMEMLQNFLPSRVPSNLDFAGNAVGAMLGAFAGVKWGRALVDGGRLHALRVRLAVDGKAADFGLVLLGLWLFAQLNPEMLLFGTGDLRGLLGLDSLPYSASRFMAIEAAVAAGGLLAAGLIAASLLRARNHWLLAVLLGAAIVVKTSSGALLVSGTQFAHWITPGNTLGLGAGFLALCVAVYLPLLAQRVLAASALLFVTVLVNLAPENPYLAAALAVWQQGHFLNFNGLTRLVSSLWPFAALPYLMLPRARQATEDHR
jgi:VanZ family protein